MVRKVSSLATLRHVFVKVTLIIPTLNEADGIVSALNMLQVWRQKGASITLVDGGSLDETVARAAPLVDQVITCAPGRALQMNAGACIANTDILLFLHADTLLTHTCLDQLTQALQQGAEWGRFDVQILGEPMMLRVVSFMMNWRSRLTGIATGDQAIFVRRDWFECVGKFPVQPLMEDIELSKRLRLLGQPTCLAGPAITSGRRWQSHGVWRTIFLMWRLRWLYWRGVSPALLEEKYR